jgi:hypothetical protein
MKIAVFWVVAPCSLVFLPDYTVLQPRRQQSSRLNKFSFCCFTEVRRSRDLCITFMTVSVAHSLMYYYSTKGPCLCLRKVCRRSQHGIDVSLLSASPSLSLYQLQLKFRTNVISSQSVNSPPLAIDVLN